MKIICNQRILSSSINTVQKAVSSKTTLPILKGILLETCGQQLKLVGTDLEIGIENYIDAEIISKGAIVLSARILGDIIRKLPDEDVEIEVDMNNNATIRCANSEFTLIGQPAVEFPELPTVEESDAYKLPQDLLKNMIKQTIFATAVDETRPILTGVLMELQEESINMVALDGYRLALRQANIKNALNNKAVIPAKTLNEINRILEEENTDVEIFFTDKHVLFNMNKTRVISRLLEGEFINYEQIIPKEYKSRVKVNTKSLLGSMERASLLAKEGKNNLVKFSVRDELMTITSNAEIGKVFESVSIELEGEDVDIGFNSKYFLDALKIIDSDEVYLEFTTSVSPCIVKPTDHSNYTYLILPVRLVG
ncbi:DNA polymerase III subunit beta [Crassaminicella thermophila]|uniref:Beta sliding clamp n=1 Tax=Crassaminicella thermophila TaxID=2599308 RepID=A0A5C0SCG6_CRATE|nr:DNA polymerase III subunit beta [Crassaminicella thermophila]QEK10884.1 DNA polymerase III subunit beta [Crassaminicella thermophila]